nr:odorant receptor 16 [Achelura yunnanensis]
MNSLERIDCFKYNIKFWRILGVWSEPKSRCYAIYSKIFTFVFTFLYVILPTLNLAYIPPVMDVFVEEMIFYFTEVIGMFKVLTLLINHDEIVRILKVLQSNLFYPKSSQNLKNVDKAKIFIIKYWKFIAAVSVTSNLTHVLSPVLVHFILSVKLELPLCHYFFLNENVKESFIYPIYLYQFVGIHAQMWYNVNFDSFILGLMILIIAQLEILDVKLRALTIIDSTTARPKRRQTVNDREFVAKLNEALSHYDELDRFCSLVQDVFSFSLFIQFSLASCVICVCLFRFTLPAPWQYYIFLATYIFVMIVQIFIPCWFGSRIIEKSQLLKLSIYSCDWTPQSRKFKSSLRIFSERVNRPIALTAGKMFALSLGTFTSIMNSAYSFFTLLRHMQSRNI